MQKRISLTLPLSAGDSPTVKKGDTVATGDVVITPKPPEIDEFNLAKILSVKPKEVEKFLTVTEGQTVTKGAVIAKKGGMLARQLVKAPLEGIFRIVDKEKGIVGIEKKSAGEEVAIWFSGIVKEVENDKIIFEIVGQAILGQGGQGHPVSGTLVVVEGDIDTLRMPIDLENKVLAVPQAYADLVAKADALGVSAIIAQNIHQPPFSLPYVLVEEFGEIAKFHDHPIIVYGNEKQILVLSNDRKTKK